MKALVTGGGGFVGKAIVAALRERGDDVRSFARGAYPDVEALGAEHMRGDITNAEAVSRACEGVDVVFHVASLVQPYGDPRAFDAVNIDGTRNVINACKAHDVERLVFTSSPSVVDTGEDALGIDESKPYPQKHLCDYFRSKAEAEQLALRANGTQLHGGGTLRTVAIRPTKVYGPGDTSLFPLLLQKARSGRLRIIGDGKTQVDWTYIDNCVSAHLLAAERLLDEDAACAGKAYFIADDAPRNPWDFFNTVLDELGLPKVQRKVPLGVAKFAGGVLEGTWRTLKLKGVPPATRAQASVLGSSSYFNLSAAKADLGYTPVVDADEGLRRTIPWLKAQLQEGAFD